MVGLLLIVLILGFMASSAVSSDYVAASTQTGENNDAYENFWKILNKEAELVEELNTTGNTSFAGMLIKNSHLGEENAANISAQVWTALQGLVNSGVKLYYSPEELRAMAQNISRNGLPAETVNELKSQGWTDDEIKALQDYIARNADNITTGFNMTSFLQNLSTAFVGVGFKYASYESWALKTWKWSGSVNFTGALPSNASINPLLAGDWVNLYEAYSGGNTTKLLNAVNSLSSRMYSLLTSPSSFKARSERLRDGNLLLRYESVGGLRFYNGGFVVVETSSTYDD